MLCRVTPYRGFKSRRHRHDEIPLRPREAGGSRFARGMTGQNVRIALGVSPSVDPTLTEPEFFVVAERSVVVNQAGRWFTLLRPHRSLV